MIEITYLQTRQQIDPAIKNKSLIKGTLSIVKTDGIKVLLSGLGPTTIGYLFEGAAKFGVYEVLKPTVQQMLSTLSSALSLPFIESRYLNFLLSGTVSGLAAAVILCPMEAIRIRLVAKPKFAKLGFIDAGILMVKKEGGLKAVYKGLAAMVSKQVPYTVTKQSIFDGITTLAYANLARTGGLERLNSNCKFLITLVSAVMAGVLSAISSQPGDTLLSLVNAHEGTKTTKDVAKELMKKEGIQGFFVGMKIRFLHVGVMVTVQLLLYDLLKRLCGIPPVILD